MKMENKRLLESTTDLQASGSHLKALVICHTEAECVELQAALAPLKDVTVEAIVTLARLPGPIHKSVSVADLVLIDIAPDSPEDISLLPHLRQFPHLATFPSTPPT